MATKGRFGKLAIFGLLLANAAICGCCQTWCGPQGIPDDPLYWGKKLKEAPAVVGPPTSVAVTDPQMPTELNVKNRGSLVERPNANGGPVIPVRLTNDPRPTTPIRLP